MNERQSAARFLRPAALRRHPARARHAGRRQVARRRARTIERVATDPSTPSWEHGRRADWPTSLDRSRPRMERGASPQRRRQHAGAARRVQREPAEGDRVLHAISRRTCACTTAIARCARGDAFAGLDAAQRKLDRQRAARLQAGRRRARRRGQGAPQGHAGGVGEALDALRGESARRDQRMGPLRRGRSGARRHPARRVAEARAGRGKAEGKSGLEAHAAHAVLPAGDAVRGRSRSSPAHARGVLDARVRSRQQRRVGQRPADRAASSRCATRPRSCSAIATTPKCRWCRRWRSTPTR